MTTPILGRLRRIRWAVRATLAVGVAASVAANILHAHRNPISEAIAGWPPLALLLTIELVSRIPMHRRSLAAVRVLATIVIAGIAAWVSYWHMAGVAARYGETDASPYLLPISVDGLIVVASISLVELAARIRTLEEPATATAVSTVVHAQGPSRVDTVGTITVPTGLELDQVPDDIEDQAVTDQLLDRARVAINHHRATTGRDITRDQLRAALRVSNATAGQLLNQLRPPPPVRRTLPVMGELTR
jgi:hypothetical protein